MTAKKPNPTPEDIAHETAAIRSGWSDRVRASRAGQLEPPEPYDGRLAEFTGTIGMDGGDDYAIYPQAIEATKEYKRRKA